MKKQDASDLIKRFGVLGLYIPKTVTAIMSAISQGGRAGSKSCIVEYSYLSHDIQNYKTDVYCMYISLSMGKFQGKARPYSSNW